MKFFKKKEQKVDKGSKKRAIFLFIVFLFVIVASSWMLLSEFPWNGSLVNWLKAREYYDQGYALNQRYILPDAEKQFLRAIKTFPGDWHFFMMLGDTQMKMSRWKEAEETFKKAQILKPNNLELQLAITECIANQDETRLAEAEQAARAAVVIDPVSSVALAQLALILQTEGKKEDALKTYNGSERLEKDSAKFWYLSGQYHLKTEELQRSETDFRQAVDLDKTNPEYLETIGMLLYSKNDLEGCEHYIRRAARMNPYNPQYWVVLGEVSRKMNQFERADEAFSKAVDLQPKNAEYLLNLGLTRFFLKDYARAEDPLRKACEIDPSDSRPLRIYLKCLEFQGKFDLEIKQLLKVLSTKENENSASWAYCGAICIKAKDFEKAQDCLKRARAMSTAAAEIQNVEMLEKRLADSKLAVAEKRATPDELATAKNAEITKAAEAELAVQAETAEKEKKAEAEKERRKPKMIIELETTRKSGTDLNAINDQDNRSKRRY